MKRLLAALALSLLATPALAAFTIADNYRPLQYTSSSNQSAFVITWPWETDSYIAVRTSPDGTTWTAKTLTTDYTLTGAATSSGGTLTFVSGHCDGTTNGCDSGTLVSIERDHPVSMASNLSSLDPTTVSRVFDRSAMSSQQVEDFAANRCIRLPVQNDYAGSGISTILPQISTGLGESVCVNAAGTGFEYCANSTDDVCGASSGTDNRAIRWNGTGVCAIQNSLLDIDDSGNTDTPAHMAAGASASNTSANVVTLSESLTGTSGGVGAISALANMVPASASTALFYGLSGTVTNSSMAFNQSVNDTYSDFTGVRGVSTCSSPGYACGGISGGYFRGNLTSTATSGGAVAGSISVATVASTATSPTASVIGLEGIASDGATHGTSDVFGGYLSASATASGHTVTNLRGVWVKTDISGGPTVTNNIGVDIQAMTGGSVNCSLRLADPTGTYTTCVKQPTMSSSWTETKPPNAGTSGYLMRTDGAGVETWVDPTTIAGPYDVSFFQYGYGINSALVYSYVFPRAVTCPDDWSGSYAKASANFNAQKIYDLQKNEVSVGSMTCAASGSTCTFSTTGTTTVFAAGDRLEIVGPSAVDTVARDLRTTFACTR